FTLEAIGAGFIFYSIRDFYPGDTGEAIFSSVFHAVSGFCNAGFSIYSANLADPIAQNNYIFTTTVSLLIILGGIGFTTLLGMPKYLKVNREPLFARLNMSLQVKIVFVYLGIHRPDHILLLLSYVHRCITGRYRWRYQNHDFRHSFPFGMDVPKQYPGSQNSEENNTPRDHEPRFYDLLALHPLYSARGFPPEYF
ncbi:MAG: hypothetical protein EDM75_13060, partial [Chlorobiota bacterium]